MDGNVATEESAPQSRTPEIPDRYPWSWKLFALVLLSLLYFGTLADSPLQEPDEGRYAEISREIVETGDWVTPRQNYVSFFHKPPLLYWGGAASMLVFGENEFAARFTPALSGLLTIWFTFLLGSRMAGDRVAFLGAGILATTPLFFAIGQAVTMDMPLTACTTLAFAGVYWLHQSENKRPLAVLTAVAAGLGILAKGPVVLVVVGLACLAFLLFTRDWESIKALCGWQPILAFLVTTMPWFILVSMRNPDFLQTFVVVHHLDRFAGSVGHPEGPFYYVPILLAGCLPWTLLALLLGLRSSTRKTFLMAPREPLLFLGLWAVVVIGFFSMAGSKLPTYMLPVLPALALLLALWLDQAFAVSAETSRKAIDPLILTLTIFGGVLVVGGAIAYPLAGWGGETFGEDPEDISSVALTLLRTGFGLTVVGGGLSFANPARNLSVPYRMAGLVVLMALTLFWVTGVRNVFKTTSELARVIEEHRRPGDTLAVYNVVLHGLPFYLGERVVQSAHRGELAPGADRAGNPEEFFWSRDRLKEVWNERDRVFLATELRHMKQLPDLDPPARMLFRDRKRAIFVNFPEEDEAGKPKASH